MTAEDFRGWARDLKSEIVGQASAAPRSLVIEHTIQL